MRIGVPTEVKNNEFRVAMTPAGVRELTSAGHEVLIQQGAGVGSQISDEQYVNAGARIANSAAEAWGDVDMVVKVKEPIAEEFPFLRSDQILFTYLHLAAERDCTEALLNAGTTSIAYETVELPDHSLPLLTPMSEVAGRLAPQVGAYHMLRSQGGSGLLPGGVPGVPPAKVTVLGCGVAGRHAAEMAAGMRSEVTVLDKRVEPLRTLDVLLDGRVTTQVSTAHALEEAVLEADLVIGAVLVTGARTPRLVSHDLAVQMKPGAVLVDISIDQGGCFEDSRPTTHEEPTYTIDDKVFYCVGNMPGAVPVTSTFALTNVTLPYVEEIAALGWNEACRQDSAVKAGLTTHDGSLLSAPVGLAHGISVSPVTTLV